MWPRVDAAKPLPSHTLMRGSGAQRPSLWPLPLRSSAQGYGAVVEVRKYWHVFLADTSTKKKTLSLSSRCSRHLCDNTVAFRPHIPFRAGFSGAAEGCGEGVNDSG